MTHFSEVKKLEIFSFHEFIEEMKDFEFGNVELEHHFCSFLRKSENLYQMHILDILGIRMIEQSQHPRDFW